MANCKALLYRLPLGADILPQFVAELKDEEDAALVLGNGLLKERVQFENITTFGLDTLAKKILNANGYTNFEFINRRTQELVIEDWIEGLMDKGSFTYFKNLTDKKGFLKAMTKFLGQLSRTGLSEEKISEQFKLWQSETNRSDVKLLKDKEVLTLYFAYRNYLKEKNWYDIQGMFRLVVWLLKQEGTKLPYKKLRVLGFYSLDNLQLEFFQELAKATDLSIAMYYGEGPAYRACQDTYNSLLSFCDEKPFAEAQEENIGIRLSKNIFKNLTLPTSSALSTNGITLNSFTSREKEMRYALTEIKKLLRKGAQAKDIAIVVRKLDDFTGLGNIADEYGLPLSLGKSCKLKVHPLFAFVKLLYASKYESHEACENYFKLLSDPITNLLVSNKLRTLWKLKEEKFYDSVHRLQNDVADALGEEAEKLAFLNNFLKNLPREASVEAYAENLTDFVTGLELAKTLGAKYKKGEISLEALKSITAGEKILLDTIKLLLKDYKDCGLEKTNMHYYLWFSILDEAAENMDVRLAFGRSDGVSILEAASMQGLFYKNIFLLGLRRDEFPRIENESWIYNDAERRELHLDLPTTDASYNEDAYFFASTLAAAKEDITISWHEEEKGERSPYVDNLLRIYLTQNPEGEFSSNLKINYLDEKELAGSLELWEQYPGLVDLDSAKDFVKEENILAAQNNCDVLEDEAHHGLLNDANLIAEVRKKAGDTFSASRLETYANCPYSYLLDNVWDLGDGKVMEEEGGPAEKGMLLHNTLSSFLNQHLHNKLDPNKKAETKAELMKIFAETWDDLIKQGKVNDGPLWMAEKTKLKGLVEKWLEAEYAFQAEWFGFTPEATELGFYDTKYPMLKLELEDGTPIYLRGSIDRLDSNGEKIFITDYKMSKTSVPTKGGLIEGSDLQMDVYLLAAKNIFKEKEIAGGGYFVLKGLERKPNLFFADVQLPKTKFEQGFVCSEAFENTAKSVIVNIVNNIYSGKFIPEDNSCNYCPYGDICRRREGLIKKEEEDA